MAAANLKTDYIDDGFIHCIDEVADWKQYRKILDDVSVDMLMFSVNPGYDYQKGRHFQ